VNPRVLDRYSKAVVLEEREVKAELAGKPVVRRLRLVLAWMTVAAAITLVLGTIGLYGVMAYMVALRTREFGVRVALGADPQRIARLVARRGLLLAGGGVAAGFGLYALLAPSLQAFLFGVTATDPMTLAGSTLVLLATPSGAHLPTARALVGRGVSRRGARLVGYLGVVVPESGSVPSGSSRGAAGRVTRPGGEPAWVGWLSVGARSGGRGWARVLGVSTRGGRMLGLARLPAGLFGNWLGTLAFGRVSDSAWRIFTGLRAGAARFAAMLQRPRG